MPSRDPVVVDLTTELVQECLLEPPWDNDLRRLVRDQAAVVLDRELRKLCRARSLIDRRLCQLLAGLKRSGGFRRLGFVRIEDYGRERLGQSDRYIRDLVRVGEQLELLPEITRALEQGEVSLSKVRAVVGVATPDTEARWLELMRRHTVRRLKERVKRARLGDAQWDDGQGGDGPGEAGPGGGGPGGDRQGDGEQGGDGPGGDGQSDGEQGGDGQGGDGQSDSEQGGDGQGDGGQGSNGQGDGERSAGSAGQGGSGDGMGDGQQRGKDRASEPDGDEQVSLSFRAPARLYGKWRWALDLARRVNEVEISDGVALEWMLMEFISTVLYLDSTGDEALQDDPASARQLERRREVRRLWGQVAASVEAWTRDWEFLDRQIPAVALADWTAEQPGDAHDIDAMLRKLTRLYNRVDWHIGRLGLTLRRAGLWRDMQFVSLQHYATERLGISPRAFADRIYLERRSFDLPGLGEAFRDGELGISAALHVARVASESTVERWIERGRSVTLQELERQAKPLEGQPHVGPGEPPPEMGQAQLGSGPVGQGLVGQGLVGPGPVGQGPVGQESVGPGQMCSSPDQGGAAGMMVAGATAGAEEIEAEEVEEVEEVERVEARETTLRLRIPAECLMLWRIARRICRQIGGEELEDWELAELVCDHFVAVWGQQATLPGPSYRVLERDGFTCTVPGCRSRRNLNEHHVVFRSAGGGEEESNRTTVCFEHHIEGIHQRLIRCRGQAPDGLLWELGLRTGGEPLVSYRRNLIVRQPPAPGG